MCIIANCNDTKPGSRGLCKTHYYAAKNMVTKGFTTWDELVEKGLATQPTRGNGMINNVSQAQLAFFSAEELARRKAAAPPRPKKVTGPTAPKPMASATPPPQIL